MNDDVLALALGLVFGFVLMEIARILEPRITAYRAKVRRRLELHDAVIDYYRRRP